MAPLCASAHASARPSVKSPAGWLCVWKVEMQHAPSRRTGYHPHPITLRGANHQVVVTLGEGRAGLSLSGQQLRVASHVCLSRPAPRINAMLGWMIYVRR